MDSDEDEVFFGPITEKEERIASKYSNRRTLVLPYRGPLVRRWSCASVPVYNDDQEYQQTLASESMHVSLISSGCDNNSLETSDHDSYGSGNRGMVISDLTDSQASSADCGVPSSNSSLNIQQHDQSQLQTEIIRTEVCDKSNRLQRADQHFNVELQSEHELTNVHGESNIAEPDYHCDPESKDILEQVHDDLHRTEPDVNSELQPGDTLAGIQDASNSLQRIELCDHNDPQPDDVLAENQRESHIHESDYQSEPQSGNILEEVCNELNRTEPDYHSESHTDDILEEICDESKRKEPDCNEQSEDMLERLQNNIHTSHGDGEDCQGLYEHRKSQTPDFLDESNDSHEDSHSLKDDFNDSHNDSHCTHNESEGDASPRFNDTLEEIEMLLKYGVNYGEKDKSLSNLLDDAENLGNESDIAVVITSDEDVKKSNPPISSPEDLGMKKSYLQNFEGKDDLSRVNTTHGETLEEIKSSNNLPDGMVIEKTAGCDLEVNADDPIVSPRKSSVTSTVSTFQPAFESTRASSCGEKHIENKPHPPCCVISESEGKREPPPKPPRNIQGISSMEKKDNTTNPSLGLSKNASCEKQKLNLKSNQSSSVKPLHLVPNSGASKLGTRLITPKRIPTVGSIKESSGSRFVQGGSGPGRLGLPPRTRPAPSPTSTPTSSRVVTKSQTPGPRPYSSKRNFKSGLPPHPPSNSRQMPTVTSKLPGSQASANKHLKPEFHKTQRQPFKPGMNNIVSPIARYLKQNPPPPLVHIIKPRHRISPGKQLGEPAKTSIDKTAEAEIVGAKRALALNGIQEKQDASSSKRKDVQAYQKEGATCKGQALPYVLTSSAMPVVLGEEDKENKMLRHRGEFLVEREPVAVLKHTGRVMVPKGVVKVIRAPVNTPTKTAEFKSPVKANVQSPTKTILKPSFPVPSLPRSSERESLVEVSICEPCNTE